MGFMYINKTNLWGSGSAASANLNCTCLHFTHTGTHLSLTSWMRRMFEKRVFLSMLIRVSFKSLDSIKCSISTRRERRYDISDVITSNMLCTQRKETHKYYIKTQFILQFLKMQDLYICSNSLVFFHIHCYYLLYCVT